MKKFLTVLLTLSIALTFVACSNEESGTPTKTESATEISFRDMLPPINDYFKNGEMTTIDSDGGKMYCVSIKNVTTEEYNAYKDACKNGNFSKVTYEFETNYEARTSDEKYYVSLQHLIKSNTDNASNIVNITCGIVTN